MTKQTKHRFPGSRGEFSRALVEMLDSRGYHNLAFAVMRCANDNNENEQTVREMAGFIDMATRFLGDGIVPRY